MSGEKMSGEKMSGEKMSAIDERGGIDVPPPFWSRWGRLYWLVAGLLAAEVLAFWLLTRWAS